MHVIKLLLLLQFLIFLPNALRERLTTQDIANQIIQFASQNEISFAESIELINFFDIPIAFDALISIRQPMPLPTNQAEEIDYNSQLSEVFRIAQGHDNNHLWQLFGSMLYPRCLQYPECAEIVDRIPAKNEPFILGGYIQQHPELYKHRIGRIDYASRPVFSPNGQIIAARQEDNLILINSATGAILRTINNTEFPIFSPNGQIIMARQGENLILINSSTGATIYTINYVYNPQFSPDGQIIAVQTTNSLILINRAKIINRENAAIGHSIDNAHSPKFSRNGQIITASQRNNLILIDSSTGAIIHTIKNAEHLEFSPDGQIIATRQEDNLLLIDSLTGAIICTFKKCNSIYFTPDGRSIITYFGHPVIISLGRAATNTEKSLLEIRGYASLREALQSPITITPDAPAPAADGSSAAPAAPHRSVTEPDEKREEEAVILADQTFDTTRRSTN